jgi:RimJ/RimL family protein N-acetyltransferase
VAASIQLPEPPTGTSPPTIAAPTRASTVAGKAGEEDAPWLAFGTIGTVRDGEVGYMIHPAAAGLGVATEALRAFGPAYFAQFPQQTEVQAIASVRNPASGRVLEKAGFVRLDGVPVEGDDAGDAVVWALDAATLEKRVR